MGSAGEGWLPVNGSPVGLVAWYEAAGPVTMLASWLAVIDGRPPELRAGCSGRQPLPADADFTINVPVDPSLPALQRLIAKTAAGAPVTIADTAGIVPARSVRAPLLAGCALQIECAHGRLVSGAWAAELAGEIMLLHRGGLFLAPVTYPDFCALQPLRTSFPS